MSTLVHTSPSPTREPAKPDPVTVARAMTVVSAGPLLLDALEVLGPVAAVAGWPRRVRRPAARRLACALTVVGVAAPLVDHLVVRPWLRGWGATAEERTRPMPGDPPDSTPLFTTTRGVTIEAPAEEVWRWLVQIGQDRGGFYSYDWLENLAGCHLHSAEEVREEWQHRGAGDPLRIFDGYSTELLEVDPPHALVIANWGAYVIEPIDDGRCRLLARSHADRDAGGAAYLLAIELPHAIMERRMMLGLKERAERAFEEASCSR